MFTDQAEFDVRCEWGEHGAAALAPTSGAVIIIDVLSFTTCVDIAVHNGAVVYPFRWRDERAAEFARSVGALLAEPKRAAGGYSLSPRSLLDIPAGTRLVLPSPNGAALTLAANSPHILAGCLRNARAVALAAARFGPRIAVIPAGERWRDDQSLRPSFEDLVGAGAVIHYLRGTRSPEAESALAAFRAARGRLEELLYGCASGKELVERGFVEDVRLAAQLDVSETAPILADGAYTRFATHRGG